MHHFYVLRANREAGPFTLAELRTYGLLSTDLIWVDGESKGWKNPSEIEGLEAVVANGVKAETKPQQDVKPAPKQPPAAPPAPPQQFIAGKEFYAAAAQDETFAAGQSKTVFRRSEKRTAVPSYTVGTRLFGAVVLLIGGLLCGFVIVNMLKQFGAKPVTASQAVEINSKDLPVSRTAHTAEAPPAFPAPLPAVAATGKKDTATGSANPAGAPVKTAEAPAAKTKPKNAKKAADKTPPPPVALEPALPVPVVDEKPEPPKVEKVPPSLNLSANDYKVGLFGGVSGLELTVSNPSGQSVAKAVIDVEFLKPNGNVVRTQTVAVENIAAGGSKTVPVPSSGRGVKVRYRVVSVE